MYRVDCVSCGRPFDAEKASDCSCIQPVRSVRCPNCAACFCKNQKKLDDFWRGATPPIWQQRRTAAAATAAEDGNASPAEIKRPMVLFADDDPTGRAIARRVITSLGYGVAVAADGEEALSMARDYKPELIITDALMPRLDGREMARMVKTDLPRTRIIVITSIYKGLRYKHEAFKQFAIDEYLAKPINPAALREVVTKYLGEQRG